MVSMAAKLGEVEATSGHRARIELADQTHLAGPRHPEAVNSPLVPGFGAEDEVRAAQQVRRDDASAMRGRVEPVFG